MRFDLFDAVNALKKEFNDDGEIRVINNDFGIMIRLSIFKNHNFYHSQFGATNTEIKSDDNVSIMNLKFAKAIIELKKISFLNE